MINGQKQYVKSPFKPQKSYVFCVQYLAPQVPTLSVIRGLYEGENRQLEWKITVNKNCKKNCSIWYQYSQVIFYYFPGLRFCSRDFTFLYRSVMPQVTKCRGSIQAQCNSTSLPKISDKNNI